MNPRQWMLALLTVAGLSAGQVLFKLAATGAAKGPALAGIALGGALCAALAVYAVATGLWLLLLRDAPLSQAYPAVALAYLVVPVLAHLWLGEALRWQALVGGGLILAGVVVAGRGA